MKAEMQNSIMTIELDTQAEALLAPGGKKYLPCADRCGKLLTVAMNVVSASCDDCWHKRQNEE